MCKQLYLFSVRLLRGRAVCIDFASEILCSLNCSSLSLSLLTKLLSDICVCAQSEQMNIFHCAYAQYYVYCFCIHGVSKILKQYEMPFVDNGAKCWHRKSLDVQ